MFSLLLLVTMCVTLHSKDYRVQRRIDRIESQRTQEYKEKKQEWLKTIDVKIAKSNKGFKAYELNLEVFFVFKVAKISDIENGFTSYEKIYWRIMR